LKDRERPKHRGGGGGEGGGGGGEKRKRGVHGGRGLGASQKRVGDRATEGNGPGIWGTIEKFNKKCPGRKKTKTQNRTRFKTVFPCLRLGETRIVEAPRDQPVGKQSQKNLSGPVYEGGAGEDVVARTPEKGKQELETLGRW